LERQQKQRRRHSKPDPISDAIKIFLRDAGLHRSPQNHLVFTTWNDLLGARASRAIPVRFVRGELIVEVDSAVHLQEFRNFTGEGYRRKVNKLLNNELVRKLTFKLKA
jgi:hypothetical protein